MEEQCKLIMQQERESSTSADESAANSPFHTPKAATAASSLHPSISAMAQSKTSGAVTRENIVDEKQLADRVSGALIHAFKKFCERDLSFVSF